MKPVGTTFYIKTGSSRVDIIRKTQIILGYVSTNNLIKSINNTTLNPFTNSNPKLIYDTFLKRIREKTNEVTEDQIK